MLKLLLPILLTRDRMQSMKRRSLTQCRLFRSEQLCWLVVWWLYWFLATSLFTRLYFFPEGRWVSHVALASGDARAADPLHRASLVIRSRYLCCRLTQHDPVHRFCNERESSKQCRAP